MPRRKMLQPPKALKGRPSAKVVARFLAKVEISEGCWLWTAHCDGNGYGQFSFDSQARGAHRVAWLIFRGGIGEGMEIDHNGHGCPHNCVNPDHLRKLSHSENSRDGAYRRHRKQNPAEVDIVDLPI